MIAVTWCVRNMRDFILRARKGPSTPDFSPDDLPGAGHLEIVCHCIANALFHALQLRDDVRVHIALDGPAAPPKVVRIESDGLGSLDGFDERALASVLGQALADGLGLQLGEEIESRPGVFVAKRSFESLVRQQCESGDVPPAKARHGRARSGVCRALDLCLFRPPVDA